MEKKQPLTRKEALIELKKRIAEKGTERYYYMKDFGEGKCYCAVGHLMDICGVDMEHAISEDNAGTSIRNIYKDDYLVGITSMFSLSELERIQQYNDGDTIQSLDQYLDHLIEIETEAGR